VGATVFLCTTKLGLTIFVSLEFCISLESYMDLCQYHFEFTLCKRARIQLILTSKNFQNISVGTVPSFIDLSILFLIFKFCSVQSIGLDKYELLVNLPFL